MSITADETIQRLEALAAHEPVPEEYVRLRVGVLRVQAAALEEITSGTSPESHLSDATLLEPDSITFPGEILGRLCNDLLDIVGGFPGVPDAVSKLRSAVAADPERLTILAKDVAREPQGADIAVAAERWGIPVGLLLLVTRLAAAPFVTAAVRTLAPLDAAAAADYGHCPRCADPPALASLSPGEGLRTLHCGLCGTDWPFARLGCPFCGNEEPGTLGRLTVGGDNARYLEVCESCKHYLTTIDRRQLPEGDRFFPLVEHVAALPLDLIAERTGHAPKPPYAALR